ncbi:MAG: hypothetical protein ACYC0T_09825 [Ramlibacter sp.]
MKTLRSIVAAIGVSAIAACGGGGSGAGADLTAAVPAAQAAISGAVTKGPVDSATVVAYAIGNGVPGAQVGTATTDARGNFNLNVGRYTGAVLLQVSGGSYIDEATDKVMPLAPGDVITALVPNVAAGARIDNVQVTPLTAMAQAMAQRMAGGMTPANIDAANTAIGNRFLLRDILRTPPIDPLLPGSGTGASQDAQNYGLTLAAISKYAEQLGMASSSALVTGLMNDASDGVLDGKAGAVVVQLGGMMGGVPLPASAGTTDIVAAMGDFMTSAQNRSGVMVAPMMNWLPATAGQTPAPVVAGKNASVSGTVFNGPVSRATVMAFAIENGAVGPQLASAAANADGSFQLSLGGYQGPVMLQVRGGAYTDPATKTVMAMRPVDFLSAALPAIPEGGSVTGVVITPMTSMAQARATTMPGGMTKANIAAANAAVGKFFLVPDLLGTRPLSTLEPGSGATAGADARNYGVALAAVSQAAKSLSLPTSSVYVTALIQDAADGVVDGRIADASGSWGPGMMSAVILASGGGTANLVTALTDFMSSPANLSGLTIADMAALKDKLQTSPGLIGP